MPMKKRIQEICQRLSPSIISWRRDFHKYPENAWQEYRTTSIIAEELLKLGYTITMGENAHKISERRDVPSQEICMLQRQQAIAQGANPKLINMMGDGFTGLWAELQCQKNVNPPKQPKNIALRFDIDALKIQECADPSHIPAREGFASTNNSFMHGCGHDAHIAIGLGIAHIVKELQNELHGTVRLIFQPAEEGILGAKSMLGAGAVDNIDYLIGLHIGIQAKNNDEIICGTSGFLASSSIDVNFIGQAAHAGMEPHKGQNALMAACVATQNILAIPRHGDGATRANVGQLISGDASNIIPAHAFIKAETRGITSAQNEYMHEHLLRIVKAAAQMWDCQYTINDLGSCPSASSDQILSDIVAIEAKDMSQFKHIVGMQDFMASEDFTYFINKVQESGGLATYIQLGSKLASGHHTQTFDFDEASLLPGVQLLTKVICKLLG